MAIGKRTFVDPGEKRGCAPSNRQERIFPVADFLKLWLLKSFVARLGSETRPHNRTSMKAINFRLSVPLANRILFRSAGPPRAAAHRTFLIEGIGRRYWYAFFRSLRAVLSGVLDSSAYDQISLGREVSVAFTPQGPVVYRYGRTSAVDSVSTTREANRRARFANRS
jgi:hypothetical protein